MTQLPLSALATMLTIRRFEEKVDELFTSGVIKGTSHLYAGQEAVAVGVCSVLSNDDLVTSTHRGHGHFIAKGGKPNALMAELFGKVTGPSKGRGGSQQVADYSVGFLGSNGITAGGLPIATGAALALQMQKISNVVIAFFGEGGANQGTFHESLNMAAIWKLPVIFICENNLYAMSTHFEDTFATPTVAARGVAYGIPGEVVDGSDFFAVQNATQSAIARAQNGDGPTLLEMQTYRYYGHSKSDKREYRTRAEEDRWHEKDPLLQLQAALKLDESTFAAMQQNAAEEIETAVKFAQESPEPEFEEWDEALFAP
jgi:pyruvate dehydrogenase E1 component alpha subunit